MWRTAVCERYRPGSVLRLWSVLNPSRAVTVWRFSSVPARIQTSPAAPATFQAVGRLRLITVANWDCSNYSSRAERLHLGPHTKTQSAFATKPSTPSTPLPLFGRGETHSGRGGTRTRTPFYGHGILNPERLPFRHSANNVVFQFSIAANARGTEVVVGKHFSMMEGFFPTASSVPLSFRKRFSWVAKPQAASVFIFSRCRSPRSD